jgi:hypothetical protein
MRVVVAEVRRALAGGGADEDEAEGGLELVGEFFHVVSFLSRERSVIRHLAVHREWLQLRPAES